LGKGKGVEFTTRLETKECADAFEELMQSSRSGFGKLIGGVTFEPPEASSNPRDSLDPPTYEVVAHCPRNRFNKAAGYGIHMYVYDLGDRRRVVLARRAAGYADIPAAEATMRKVLDGFRRLDDSLTAEV
jgi:hypothetical protein